MIVSRGMTATFFNMHRFEAADKVEWGGMQGGVKLLPEILSDGGSADFTCRIRCRACKSSCGHLQAERPGHYTGAATGRYRRRGRPMPPSGVRHERVGGEAPGRRGRMVTNDEIMQGNIEARHWDSGHSGGNCFNRCSGGHGHYGAFALWWQRAVRQMSRESKRRSFATFRLRGANHHRPSWSPPLLPGTLERECSGLLRKVAAL